MLETIWQTLNHGWESLFQKGGQFVLYQAPRDQRSDWPEAYHACVFRGGELLETYRSWPSDTIASDQELWAVPMHAVEITFPAAYRGGRYLAELQLEFLLDNELWRLIRGRKGVSSDQLRALSSNCFHGIQPSAQDPRSVALSTDAPPAEQAVCEPLSVALHEFGMRCVRVRFGPLGDLAREEEAMVIRWSGLMQRLGIKPDDVAAGPRDATNSPKRPSLGHEFSQSETDRRLHEFLLEAVAESQAKLTTRRELQADLRSGADLLDVCRQLETVQRLIETTSPLGSEHEANWPTYQQAEEMLARVERAVTASERVLRLADELMEISPESARWPTAIDEVRRNTTVLDVNIRQRGRRQ